MDEKIIIERLTALRKKYLAHKHQTMAEAVAACMGFDEQIENIDLALHAAANAKKSVVCRACAGTGDEAYTDAAGSKDDRPCSRCRGTGIDAFAGA